MKTKTLINLFWALLVAATAMVFWILALIGASEVFDMITTSYPNQKNSMPITAINSKGLIICQKRGSKPLVPPLVWGDIKASQIDKILGLPADVLRLKVRCRPDNFAKAFVKTPSGVSEHYLETADDDCLRLSFEVAKNLNRLA